MDWMLQTHDEEVVRDGRGAVSPAEPWALVEHFAGLVRESGSEDERQAAAYLRARLESFGLQPVVHEPELYLSVPRSAELEVVGPRPTMLECKVPAFARSTGDHEPLEDDLVEVESSAIDDMSGLFTASASRIEGVHGRIALLDGYAMPRVVRQLERAGALGAIFVNPGHAHEGIITSIWGNPGLDDRDRIPDFLALNVPRVVGEELRDRLEAGRCRVRIRTQLWRGWARCPVVVVDIPGRRSDFVLIHGHYDSWHEGIGDNAVGDAALLEVARVVHGLRDRLERGVRVAWWPAHSTGRYAGSTWYADAFAMELRDRCVAQIDVDSPGCAGATRYDHVMWMAEAEGLARAAIRGGAGAEAQGMRPLRAGDWSFNQIGLTGFFMLLSNIPEEVAEERGYYPVGGCGGNSDAWHTEGDTLEVADEENLVRDIRVYVDAVLRLATAEFLPLDHRAAVREIAEHVRGYAEAAEGEFDAGPLLRECEALRRELDELYRVTRRMLGAGDAAAVRDLDRVQIEVARELVPVHYARRRYHHDPALEVPPVPDLAVLRRWEGLEGDPDGRRFALNQALRGRNRVQDAVRRARGHVGSRLSGMERRPAE